MGEKEDQFADAVQVLCFSRGGSMLLEPRFSGIPQDSSIAAQSSGSCRLQAGLVTLKFTHSCLLIVDPFPLYCECAVTVLIVYGQSDC